MWRVDAVQIVNESFMPLIGERRTVPALAGLLDAMPQLRHLDLFWQGAGDNQSSMKDPKHLRTLARATHLRCGPLATAPVRALPQRDPPLHGPPQHRL